MKRRNFLLATALTPLTAFLPRCQHKGLSQEEVDEFVMLTLENMKKQRWAQIRRNLKEYKHATSQLPTRHSVGAICGHAQAN